MFKEKVNEAMRALHEALAVENRRVESISIQKMGAVGEEFSSYLELVVDGEATVFDDEEDFEAWVAENM